MKRHVLLTPFAIVALCGCAATVHIPREGLRSKPFNYGEIARLLESEAKVPKVSVGGYQRDSIGSKLFIEFSFRKADEAAYRTAVVTREGIRIVPGYAAVWYDDLENPVIRLEGGRAWYDELGRVFFQFEDANYILKNGPVIPRKATSGIMGVSGGDYVIPRFREKAAWIVSRPESPRQELFALPEDFEPFHAYAIPNELIIFGLCGPPHRVIVKCLIYQQSSTGYRLSEEIPISWAGAVYDMATKTGDVLIAGDSQKFAGFYRFNVRTKHRARLGFAPSNDVLFLKDDVIRTLDAALKRKRPEKGP